MSEPFAELADEIRQVRSSGAVLLHLEPLTPGADDITTLDGFVLALGFLPLGAAWITISPEQAARVIATLIAQDLAYHSQITDRQTALELAGRFLGCFDPGVRCFTNGSWHEGAMPVSENVIRGVSWTPLTGATFDGGVVCLDGRQAGMFWVEDED